MAIGVNPDVYRENQGRRHALARWILKSMNFGQRARMGRCSPFCARTATAPRGQTHSRVFSPKI